MNAKLIIRASLLCGLASLNARSHSSVASDIEVVIIGPELFHEDTMAMLGNIGFWRGIANLGRASSAQKTLFEALKACFGGSVGPYRAYDPATHAELPKIMVDWLLGTKTPQEINHDVQEAFKSYPFASKSERDFMTKIAAIIFDPKKLGNAMKRTSDVHELIKRIAESSPHTLLIMAANFDTQTFAVLKDSKEGKKVLPLFGKRTYVSGDIGVLLQDPEFLKTVMQKNNLSKPRSCLVISSEPHVITAARDLNMHTHQLNHASDLKAYLKRHHLIS